MSRQEFDAAFIKYCTDGGHSWDPWDLAYAYSDYLTNPDKYSYLTQE